MTGRAWLLASSYLTYCMAWHSMANILTYCMAWLLPNILLSRRLPPCSSLVLMLRMIRGGMMRTMRVIVMTMRMEMMMMVSRWMV